VLILLASALAPRQAQDDWTERLTIPVQLTYNSPRHGSIQPVAGEEWRTEYGIVQLMDDRTPVIGGILMLRRGGFIDGWNVATRRRAWSLPSRSAQWGWTLDRDRVRSILPDGPADWGGVVAGDRILESRPAIASARAGDRVELDLLSTGGRRRVTVTADRPPEPLGAAPGFAAALDDGALISRDGFVERLKVSDGSIAWSVRGRYVAHRGSLVLLGRAKDVVGVDLATGAERWITEGAAWRASLLPSGPILPDFPGPLRLRRLNPDTGHDAWTLVAEGEWFSSVHELNGGRMLVRSIDPACSRSDGMGGTPLHDAPTCETWRILDAITGQVLWRRITGGRPHGGWGRRGVGTYLPFDPLRGGACVATGGDIAWYDTAKSTLEIIDAATLRRKFECDLPDAERFDEDTTFGALALFESRSLAWIDRATGAVRRIAAGHRAYPTYVGSMVILHVNQEDPPSHELVAYDATPDPPARRWSHALRLRSGGWSTSDGRWLLTTDHENDSIRVVLIDPSTGRDLLNVAHPNKTYWSATGSGRNFGGAVVADPWVIVTASDGIHVYRRK